MPGVWAAANVRPAGFAPTAFRAARARAGLRDRVPALGIRRSRGLHPARAPAARRRRDGVEPGRPGRRLHGVSLARVRLAGFPAGSDHRQGLDGARLDSADRAAAPPRRTDRAAAGVSALLSTRSPAPLWLG